MYAPIVVKEVSGSGSSEVALIEVPLSVGDEIHMLTDGEVHVIKIHSFEPGSWSRRVVLLCKKGGYHLEPRDTLSVWRKESDA